MVFADSEFKYFDDKINYWSSDKKVEIKKTEKLSPTKKPKDTKTFNWSNYLNPKNDDFFKEGNYTPPAPFMELARNPTDKNIKNWIAYNKLKNQLSKRLQTRMQTYLAKNTKGEKQKEAITLYKKKVHKIKVSAIDPARYRVRMFFDSKCPHCKKMFGTLVKLQSAGVFVEALQVDKGTLRSLQYPIPIRPASQEEIKQHKIEAVPFTLIADLKKKVLYPPLRGYQSMNTVMNLLKEADNL